MTGAAKAVTNPTAMSGSARRRKRRPSAPPFSDNFILERRNGSSYRRAAVRVSVTPISWRRSVRLIVKRILLDSMWNDSNSGSYDVPESRQYRAEL